MTSHVPNPLAYAVEEFNVAINSHGDFTFVRFGRDLDQLRVRLQSGPATSLVRRLTDLDDAVTSLFACRESDALILVREAHSCDFEDCDFDLGDVSVASTTHEGLMATIELLDLAADDPDDFLGSFHSG